MNAQLMIWSLLIVATGVCFGAAEPAEESAKTNPPLPPGLVVQLSTPREAYAPGDAIPLVITLINNTDEVVVVGKAWALRSYEFTVLLPNAEAAPLTLYGQSLRSTPHGGSRQRVEMKPGEKMVQITEPINRIFDMTLQGKYEVSATRRMFPATDNQDGPEVVSVPLHVVVDHAAAAALDRETGHPDQ